MFNRLLPVQIDNAYRGYWLALLFYVPVVLMKFTMGLNVAGLNPWVNNRDILSGVDGIPLDTFGAPAASMIVFSSASWALGLLLLSSLCLLVLIRYRAMIPLMFLVLTLEQVGRKGLSLMNPIVKGIESQGLTLGAMVNWGLTAALVAGLLLSLLERSTVTSPAHRA
ncbi:MAG: hypothetical protein K8S25_08200 [Alphaproteobacteria bacterium]|nr:hypothetical protein [Alphaproteobacteria bacterium]